MQKLGGVLILMKNVNYMIGSENITTSPLVTYNDEVCKFLNDLSSIASAQSNQSPFRLAKRGRWAHSQDRSAALSKYSRPPVRYRSADSQRQRRFHI